MDKKRMRGSDFEPKSVRIFAEDQRELMCSFFPLACREAKRLLWEVKGSQAAYISFAVHTAVCFSSQ